ncbi:MAG: ABC transporter permease [bacterium]|jgi:lipopolysaccharide transport system permease protein
METTANLNISGTGTSSGQPLVVIEPSRGVLKLDWAELWHYRELFYFLVWQQIMVRYKQTVLGAAWAIIQPFLMMIIFSVVFAVFAGMDTAGVPAPLFFLVGILPWNFFAQSLTFSSGSLVNNANLVTKIYFPRLIMPFAPVLACLVDFAIASLLLLIMMPYYHFIPSSNIWLFPFMFILIIFIASGAGMLFSALTVKYRDFRHIIPFIVQLGMYATPVVYPANKIPEKWHLVYGLLNPMAGAISGIRWSLLGTDVNPFPLLGASAVSAGMLFLLGLYYFRRTERFFADVI